MFVQKQRLPAFTQSDTLHETGNKDGVTGWAARSYWILMIGAFLLAIGNGVANTWDGAYLLFRAINDGKPYISHGRSLEAILQWPTVGLSHLTSNMTLLRAAFTGTYASVPLLALALCWWITRGRSFHLFVWPAIGIGLATLPGQINLSADANVPAQLFWPVLLAIAVGVNRPQLLAITAVSLAILFSHPFAVPMFGFGTVVGVIVLYTGKRPSVKTTGPAIVSAVFLLLAIIKFLILKSQYDSEQLTTSILGPHFSHAILGRPLLMLLLALIVCGIVLATTHLKYWVPRWSRERRHSGTMILLCCIVLTIAGLSWAMDYRAWGGAVDFRTFIAPVSLVVMAFTVIDVLAIARRAVTLDAIDRNVRTVAMFASAGAFAAVFVVQTVTWSNLNDRLRGDVAKSPTPCIAVSSLPWAAETAFGHWSVTPLSLLLQGHAPQKVVITQANCDQAQLQRGIPVSTFDRIGYSGGWFDLRVLRGAVARGGVHTPGQGMAVAAIPSHSAPTARSPN